MKKAKRKKSRNFRVVTHLQDQTFISTKLLRNLESSLSAGSKKRLDEYRTNLAITRGDQNPNYDPKVEQVLLNYALDTNYVKKLIDYLHNLKDDQGQLFSRNLKVYQTIEAAMKRFSLDDYTPFTWNKNYKQAKEQVLAEYSKLHLKPLVYKSDQDIVDAVPRMDTHSGFTYIITGEKQKGKNMDRIYSKYLEEESQALLSGNFNKPILIGFRTQGSGEFDDLGNPTNTCKHKLRVVSMIDLYQIIAELKFAKPIQEYMGKVDYYAGGKSFDEIGRIISGYKAKHKYFVTLDYSSYDQTISSWLIRDAFEILRSAFPVMTKQDSELYEVIVDSFINKQFVLNEGIVKSSKGVPSGSMFTQIIDSIVNRLMVLTYFYSIDSSCKMIIMGDDNTIFSNAVINLDLIASYIRKNFGIEVNPDKSMFGQCLKDDLEFLSCFWRDNGRWRCPEILCSKLLYSERYRKYGTFTQTHSFYGVAEEKEVSYVVQPEMVVWSFIMTYQLGMSKLIDVGKFCRDNPISNSLWIEYAGDVYLPGAMSYIRNYTMKNNRHRGTTLKYLKNSSFIKNISDIKKKATV